MIDCPFSNKYPFNYISDGTRNGHYAYGVFWDYSKPFNPSSSKHVGYLIGKGFPEEIEPATQYEPPVIEPVEYEEIRVRPRIKRNRKVKGK